MIEGIRDVILLLWLAATYRPGRLTMDRYGRWRVV